MKAPCWVGAVIEIEDVAPPTVTVLVAVVGTLKAVRLTVPVPQVVGDPLPLTLGAKLKV